MTEFVCSTMMLNDEEIQIEGYIIYSRDSHYGADADGNRAVSKTFVKGCEDVMAHDSNGDSVALTDSEKEQAIDILTHKFLEG